MKPSDFRIKEAATAGVHCWWKAPAPESRFSKVSGHTFTTTAEPLNRCLKGLYISK